MATSLFRRSKSGRINVSAFIKTKIGSAAKSSIATGFFEQSSLNHRTLTCQGGSYSTTGASAVLTKSTVGGANYTLFCNGGSYTIAGASAGVARNRKLTANGGGSYVLAGANATLLKSKLLVVQGGSYVYVGQTVVLTKGAAAAAYVLTALGGSYSVQGNPVIVLRSKRLVSSGGSYTLSGSTSTILKSKVIVSNGGSYSITGATTTILRSKKLTASGGVYTYTGSTISISKTTVGAIWPEPQFVAFGITYGPTGSDYIGTLIGFSEKIKLDITTGALVKIINDRVVMTL